MPNVTRNDSASRYEIFEGDTLAGVAAFHVDGDVVTMDHTEVQRQFEGRGIAGELVGFALDDIRSAGRRVRPVCSYVDRFIHRHPQYHDLVAPTAG